MNLLFSFAVLIADIVAIVDCAKSNQETGKKTLWILAVILLPIVGVVLYFLLGKKK